MKNIGTIVLAVGTIIVVFLGFTNGAPATFSLFGAALSVPSGALLLAGYAGGFIFTFAMLLSRVTAQKSSDQRLQQWVQQDEKLLTQVQTDREKQLEAKIATLEAALQRALKK